MPRPDVYRDGAFFIFDQDFVHGKEKGSENQRARITRSTGFRTRGDPEMAGGRPSRKNEVVKRPGKWQKSWRIRS